MTCPGENTGTEKRTRQGTDDVWNSRKLSMSVLCTAMDIYGKTRQKKGKQHIHIQYTPETIRRLYNTFPPVRNQQWPKSRQAPERLKGNTAENAHWSPWKEATLKSHKNKQTNIKGRLILCVSHKTISGCASQGRYLNKDIQAERLTGWKITPCRYLLDKRRLWHCAAGCCSHT